MGEIRLRLDEGALGRLGAGAFARGLSVEDYAAHLLAAREAGPGRAATARSFRALQEGESPVPAEVLLREVRDA